MQLSSIVLQEREREREREMRDVDGEGWIFVCVINRYLPSIEQATDLVNPFITVITSNPALLQETPKRGRYNPS